MDIKVNNVKIVNTATIVLELSSQEEIDAFIKILEYADYELRRRYGSGNLTLSRELVNNISKQLEKEKLLKN